MLAIVIAALARAIPMVRMISPIRSFWWPKTFEIHSRVQGLHRIASRRYLRQSVIDTPEPCLLRHDLLPLVEGSESR